MDDFLRDLENRFKNEKKLKGVDEDLLWKGIEDALGKDTPSQASFHKKNKNRFYFLILLLCLGIGFCFLNNNDENEASYTKKESDIYNNDVKGNQNNLIVAEDNEVAYLSEGVELESINEAVKNNIKEYRTNPIISERKKNNLLIEGKNINTQEHKIPTIDILENTLEYKLGLNYNEQHKVPTKNNDSTLQAVVREEKGNITKNQKETIKETTNHEKSQKSQNNQKATNVNNVFLHPLAIIKPQDKTEKLSHRIQLLINKEKDRGKKNFLKDQMSWQIGIQMGLNWTFDSYKENKSFLELNEMLRSTHSPEMGYSSAVHILGQYKKIRIKTGLEWYESQQEFSTTQTDETTMPLIQSNGEVRIVPAIAEREVLWDNKYRHISLPIEIGISKKIRRFHLGIFAGIGLNQFVIQKGKTLDREGGIIEIDMASDLHRPYKSIFVSYHISPFVHYEISKKISFSLNQNVRFQQHGLSKAYQLDRSAWLIGINGGVMYAF